MRSILYISIFLCCIACTSKKKKEEIAQSLPERVAFFELTNNKGLEETNLSFSEEGAYFQNNTSAYGKGALPEISSEKGVNVSIWFKNTAVDPIKERMLFNIHDTINNRKNLSFWLAGNRITGNINQFSLWAKEYDYAKGGSKEYYDLFRLEEGKYYFLSINIFKNEVEVFINGQLYSKYANIPDTGLQYHTVYLGIQKATDGTYQYPFEGTLRNFSIFNQALTAPEIKKLSQEAYAVIQPLNDAFELSKFNLEE
ncbi:MAG: hypothetical protein CMC70_08410 [Flavobacteriaceae bacterium]|nr:hypothetical protein [Flavobacteriaceae bacterium]